MPDSMFPVFSPIPEAPNRKFPSKYAGTADKFLPALSIFRDELVAYSAALVAYFDRAVSSGGSAITGVSATSMTIQTGQVSLTATPGKQWVAGQVVWIWHHAAGAGMVGRIAEYAPATGALTVDVEKVRGAGSFDSWTVFVSAYAPATTDADGAVELATAAETLAGTDAALVPSVAALRQAYLSWQRDDAGRFPGLIPPAFNLFAPNLALPGTVAFSRASSAWRLNAAGLVVPAAINVPRFDYGADGNLLGLRLESPATRLNTIAAAPVSPESVAVTAQAYTVSFFGAGSVVLSGAHAATVDGAGPLPARMSYTFTPAAGTLTLTPSGDVRHLQVEAGAFATSPILGEGSQVTRTADACNVALSGIDFNVDEGTVYVEAVTAGPYTSYEYFVRIDDGGVGNQLRIMRTAGRVSARVEYGGTNQVILDLGDVPDNRLTRVAFAWKANDFKAVRDGGTPVTATAGSVPPVTTLKAGLNHNGCLRHLAYFPRALAVAKLHAMTL